MTADPTRAGFTDGLFNRPANSPPEWKDAPCYLKGFLAGAEAREKYNLTEFVRRFRDD